MLQQMPQSTDSHLKDELRLTNFEFELRSFWDLYGCANAILRLNDPRYGYASAKMHLVLSNLLNAAQEYYAGKFGPDWETSHCAQRENDELFQITLAARQLLEVSTNYFSRRPFGARPTEDLKSDSPSYGLYLLLDSHKAVISLIDHYRKKTSDSLDDAYFNL